MTDRKDDIEERGRRYLELVARHKVAVWALCLRRAHYDEHAAADMVQEVWMALWQYFDSLRSGCTAEQERRWVMLRARGILLRKQLRLRDGIELRDEVPDLASQPEERDERLLRLLDCLSADDRRLVQMHLDGYDYDEIGAAFGISAMAARMRKSRLVKRMRQMAEQSGERKKKNN